MVLAGLSRSAQHVGVSVKGLHLFIYCKGSYLEFLPHCVSSIDRYIEDTILSRHLIVNDSTDLSLPGFTVIEDQELWRMLDPDLAYPSLFTEKWIMQQIFKLSVGQIVQGDVLIVDADLLFTRPVRLVQDGKYRMFFSREYDPEYFRCAAWLADVTKQTQQHQSFITDFAVFNTDILDSLLRTIESKHGMSWLEAVRTMLTLSGYNLSEFELYGNYVLSKFADRVDSLIDPVDYIMHLDLDWQGLDFDQLIAQVHDHTNNYYQCIRLGTDDWLEYK